MKSMVLKQCALLALVLSVGFQLHAEGNYGPRMVGIYNNLTKASNIPSIYPPAISIRNSLYANVVGKPFFLKKALPVTIELKFHDNIRPEPYVITIKRDLSAGDCPGGTMRIVAKVEGFEGTPDSEQKVCVSRAVNMYMVGQETYCWQNLMLLLADNPTFSSVPGSLPFKFELCAWTASRPPWDKMNVFHPSDTNKITFDPPLRVIQGFPAWGGGILPRAGFGHIAHVYNNSDYIMYITREGQDPVSSQYNFSQMVPPRCIMPFAMAFIPNVGEDAYTQRAGIRVFAMQAPKAQTQLPPSGFTEISSAGTYELGPSLPDVDSTVDNMLKNQERDAANILGIPSLDDMLSSKYSKYFIDSHFYNIFTVNNVIKMQQCDIKSGDCEDIYSHPTPAFKSGLPGYFKLVATPDKDGAGLVLTIGDMPIEKPF